MDWSTPDFEEVKMDAEIGSYQEDYEPVGDVPPVVRGDADAE